MSHFLFSAFLAFLLASLARSYPREVSWSDETFGPDGPWQAVSVGIGYDQTPLNLYPGSAYETWIIDDDYCDSGACYASKAGTYQRDSDDSEEVAYPGSLNTFMLGLDLDGSEPDRGKDRMDISGSALQNVSLVFLDSQKIKYPGGKKSPFFAGCLSVGGNQAVNQTFSLGDGVPAVNYSIPAGWFFEQEGAPSNSFGLHIGSVEPRLSGSLVFGGYDKNRVAGDVLTTSKGPRDGITLKDISIDVIGGKSPFSFNSKEGLLTTEDSSAGSSLKVKIDGCSPYLTLPKSTCDNIASNLPVKFDKDLGLYLWDTESDQYGKIIPSQTALSFTFISGSNIKPVKIHVPFMHLNLTLSEPLVESPTPYFPCHVNGKEEYVLGRAFLQDAFVGANWDADVDKWWLAQAPGRSIQETTDIVPIEEKDGSISKGQNDWKASWDGVWNDAEDEEDGEPGDSPEDPSNNNSGGLATGAKIGVGVGVSAAVLIIGLLIFLYLHRRNKVEAEQPAQQPYSEAAYDTSSKYPSRLPPSELDSQGGLSQDMSQTSTAYHRSELP